MATIVLDYDARNSAAQKALEQFLALGLFKAKTEKKKMTRLERALEDVEKGRVHRLITPQWAKSNG